MLRQLEDKLEEVFVTRAPVQLPTVTRQWLAEYAWVFALVAAVFGLFLGLPVLFALVGIAGMLGAATGAGNAVVLAWLSLFAVMAYTALLIVAVPKLRAREKSGWNLILIGTLLWFCFDVLNDLLLFRIGSLFAIAWTVVITGASLYFIFQIREYFTEAK